MLKERRLTKPARKINKMVSNQMAGSSYTPLTPMRNTNRSIYPLTDNGRMITGSPFISSSKESFCRSFPSPPLALSTTLIVLVDGWPLRNVEENSWYQEQRTIEFHHPHQAPHLQVHRDFYGNRHDDLSCAFCAYSHCLIQVNMHAAKRRQRFNLRYH